MARPEPAATRTAATARSGRDDRAGARAGAGAACPAAGARSGHAGRPGAAGAARAAGRRRTRRRRTGTGCQAQAQDGHRTGAARRRRRAEEYRPYAGQRHPDRAPTGLQQARDPAPGAEPAVPGGPRQLQRDVRTRTAARSRPEGPGPERREGLHRTDAAADPGPESTGRGHRRGRRRLGGNVRCTRSRPGIWSCRSRTETTPAR